MAVSVLRLEERRSEFLTRRSAVSNPRVKPFVVFERDSAVIKRLNERLIDCIKSGDTLGATDALQRGADVNARDSTSRTALMLAVIKDKPELAMFLVKAGASVNAADDFGQTPLMWAAMGGNASLVSYLIEKGANVKATDVHGSDALMMSVHGNRKTAEILVKAGAEPRQTDTYGKSALDRAESIRQTEIAAFLLECSFSPA